MKVLLITTLYAEYGKGGTERSAQLTAESIVAAGHQCVVVTAAWEPGTRKETLRGVTVYHVGLRNLYWPFSGLHPHAIKRSLWHLINSYNPWMAQAVGKIIAEECPDVMNTRSLVGFSCSVWRMSQMHGIPICHTLHDHALMCPNSVMCRNGKNCDQQCRVCRAYTMPARRLSARVQCVIGISNYILQRHLDAGYFPHAALRKVIYNASAPRSRASVPTPNQNDGVRFGFVGRLIPGKGLEALLQAFQQLGQTEASLVVAGDGDPDYVRGLQTSYAVPGVTFMGHVAPSVAYERIDVLVAPSLFSEALGRVVLEAYQYGIPAIVSNRGGLPELVDVGRTGYIFDGDAPSSLVGMMMRFAREPQLARKMRADVLCKAEAYSISRYQQDYVEVLHQVAGGRQATLAPVAVEHPRIGVAGEDHHRQ